MRKIIALFGTALLMGQATGFARAGDTRWSVGIGLGPRGFGVSVGVVAPPRLIVAPPPTIVVNPPCRPPFLMPAPVVIRPCPAVQRPPRVVVARPWTPPRTVVLRPHYRGARQVVVVPAHRGGDLGGRRGHHGHGPR